MVLNATRKPFMAMVDVAKIDCVEESLGSKQSCENGWHFVLPNKSWLKILASAKTHRNADLLPLSSTHQTHSNHFAQMSFSKPK